MAPISSATPKPRIARNGRAQEGSDDVDASDSWLGGWMDACMHVCSVCASGWREGLKKREIAGSGRVALIYFPSTINRGNFHQHVFNISYDVMIRVFV